MEEFRDLFIRGSPEQLAETMQLVEGSLTDGWSRNYTVEGRFQEARLPQGVYCFSRRLPQERASATVILVEQPPDCLGLFSVLASSWERPQRKVFNDLLQEFCDRFVRPACQRTGAAVELTDKKVDLEHWLSPSTAAKLRDFAATANKSTSAGHPSDRGRWLDFVVAAHREGTSLDALSLRRWLVEVGGWPPEVAGQLALEYEMGREVLAFSESSS